ncbi:hypothetical protein [Paenibacillus sp. W4I10]|nr:hypothetical protein [Paenibacillus sp. W4I10]
MLRVSLLYHCKQTFYLFTGHGWIQIGGQQPVVHMHNFVDLRLLHSPTY